MKKISEIIESLKNNGIEFEIGFDGGRGMFRKGAMKGMTVIWSYGGGWEHVSIDGKKRMPTWDEMCQLKDMFFKEDGTLLDVQIRIMTDKEKAKANEKDYAITYKLASTVLVEDSE